MGAHGAVTVTMQITTEMYTAVEMTMQVKVVAARRPVAAVDRPRVVAADVDECREGVRCPGPRAGLGAAWAWGVGAARWCA